MERFSTSDIVLAAFLKAIGTKLYDIQRQGNKGTFIFTNADIDIIDQYDLGLAQVEPKTLNHEIKALTTAARRNS